MHSILVVEDERWVRAAIKRTIERTGLPFTVAGECGNGLEALDWLEKNPVDLVLTDIRMPVMDGLTFLDQLRERNRSLPVIILTGHESFSFVQQALRAGAMDYLLKPVEVDEIRPCLEKWLKERTLPEEPSGPPRRKRQASGLPSSR
ncbi:response regulator [Paenibacillus sp. CC-CFT747]|nr:response regulator [Paenibacillus sp. CC-CFT747]